MQRAGNVQFISEGKTINRDRGLTKFTKISFLQINDIIFKLSIYDVFISFPPPSVAKILDLQSRKRPIARDDSKGGGSNVRDTVAAT